MAGRSRRVVWTEFAQDGLDSTLEYIGEDSPDAAERFLDVVLETAQSLSFLSERGRVVPEFQWPDTREIFVYRHRMIYQVTPSEVHIVAFLHGARDFGDWVS
jgi:plasmid stabilization system protein ParE